MSTVTLVVMGVSGSGKTTVAKGVAAQLGWVFAEGDDFHPAANVAKMRAGTPLTDSDRRPWLQSLADWISAREAAGVDAVLTCSALKRAYRDVLRAGHPSVRFAYVAVDASTLRVRLAARKGHYMPASLLDSQLATLQPLAADEPGWTIAGEQPAEHAVTRLVAALATTGEKSHP